MEDPKPAIPTPAVAADPAAQVPASSTVAPVVLPGAPPAVVPTPASDKK